MEHRRHVHPTHPRRTFRRLAPIIAAGLLTAGLVGLPSISGADGGNGNGGNGGNGGSGGNGNGGAHDNGGGNGNSNGGGDHSNGDGTDNGAVICHIPPGNPANGHTIEVGAPAVSAHLAHGDTLGACSAATTTTQSPTSTTEVTTTTEVITTTTEVATTTTEPSTTTSTTVPLERTVTVSYTPSGNPMFCNVVVDLANYVPSQTYAVTVTQNGNYGVHPDSPWTFEVTTDATGVAQLTPFTYYQGDDENAVFNATADGVNSGDVNVDC